MVPISTIGIRRTHLCQPDDKRLTLKSLLCRVKVLKVDGKRIDAKEPIDRVYSLLGVANDEPARCIVPNYTPGGCVEAYAKTAQVLLSHGHLNILGLYRQRAIGGGHKLPLWAPDWLAPNRQPWTCYQEDELFNASGSSSASISFTDSAVDPILMHISGFTLDTVGCAG